MLPGTVAAKFLASAVARRGVITTIKNTRGEQNF